MNQRVRKKKKIGEFIQYGFHINFNTTLSEEALDELLDGLILLSEAHSLSMGGGGGGDFEFFITGVKRYRSALGFRYRWRSCTEDDRALFQNWFDGKEVTDLVVGPLLDSNR